MGIVAAPKDRIAAGFNNEELNRHKFFSRYQSLYALFEYSFFRGNIWSAYLNVPYSRRWETDQTTTRRLDNIHIGTRLGFPKNRYIFLLGLDGELATGNEEKDRIGSNELGSLQPYFGFLYQKNWIAFGAIRYKAQTNKNFREDEEHRFQRTAYLDLTGGYRFSSLDILLEYRYMHRKDPKNDAISNSTIAPAINFQFDYMQLSISMPYALSKEREFDIAGKIEFTGYFQD